jgi:hypothetical protein
MKKVVLGQLVIVAIAGMVSFNQIIIISSLALASYFSVKFYWQYHQFLSFALVAKGIELPAQGNFSRAQSLMLVLGNFLVVGMLFYYPSATGKTELLIPMVALYTIHLIAFMVSVRLWEKSSQHLFPVVRESVINS